MQGSPAGVGYAVLRKYKKVRDARRLIIPGTFLPRAPPSGGVLFGGSCVRDLHKPAGGLGAPRNCFALHMAP
jgi:hypothetical protein